MKKGKAVLVYFTVIASVLILSELGSRTVSVISENNIDVQKHCIIIDAGHGGVDGGATSVSGKLEKHTNLEIAVRLNDLFQFMGYKTKMIRTSDISVYTVGETIAQKKISDLKERVRLVNEEGRGILLSIHQNFYPHSKYKGAQVFYAKTKDSQMLAEALQKDFSDSINPGNNRTVKPCSGIYLMEHIKCTGVLIECGFLSNPVEDALLKTEEYQKKLCCVIGTTVSQFLSNT